jgi:hypothetical protein
MYACENECLFDSIREENHGRELPPMAAPTEVPDSEVPPRFASTVAIESVATTREPEILAMFVNQQLHNR